MKRNERSDPEGSQSSNSRKRFRPNVSGGSVGGGGHGNNNASVFVGQLSTRTTWQDLKDHMRKAGNVDRANILKNHAGESKGCALVDYQHPREADRAIRELDKSVLDGQRILVRANENASAASGDRNPNHPNNNNNNLIIQSTVVYVGNLDYGVSWQTLKDRFKPYGRVEHAEVAEEPGGRSRGWGLVRFANAADAAVACREMNDQEWMGRPLQVRPDRNNEQPSATTTMNDRTTSHHDARTAAPSSGAQIYVGNLSYKTSWQDLKDFVRQVCNHDDVHVEIKEGPDGRSKGYGLVRFGNEQQAARAIRQLNEKELNGRQLFVRPDRQGGSASGGGGEGGQQQQQLQHHHHQGECQLVVKNLNFGTTWQDLKDHFRQCGGDAVEHVEIWERPGGGSKGMGRVRFSNANDAARAVQQLNGVELQGRILDVSFDKHTNNTTTMKDENDGGYNHTEVMESGLKASR